MAPYNRNTPFADVDERHDPGTKWLKDQWRKLRDAGETMLSWMEWARSQGIVVRTDGGDGWGDGRRVTVLPLSIVGLHDDGERSDVPMYPIIAVPDGKRPRRVRHRPRGQRNSEAGTS